MWNLFNVQRSSNNVQMQKALRSRFFRSSKYADERQRGDQIQCKYSIVLKTNFYKIIEVANSNLLFIKFSSLYICVPFF